MKKALNLAILTVILINILSFNGLCSDSITGSFKLFGRNFYWSYHDGNYSCNEIEKDEKGRKIPILNLKYSDYKVMVNKTQIPAYICDDFKKTVVVFLDDIINYGFDVEANNDAKIITNNKTKIITPVKLPEYKPDEICYTTIDVKKIVHRKHGRNHETNIDNVYCVGERIAIPAKELSYFGKYTTDIKNKIIEIKTR